MTDNLLYNLVYRSILGYLLRIDIIAFVFIAFSSFIILNLLNIFKHIENIIPQSIFISYTFLIIYYKITYNVMDNKKEEFLYMEKIESFNVNHELLKRGLYVSRKDYDNITN